MNTPRDLLLTPLMTVGRIGASPGDDGGNNLLLFVVLSKEARSDMVESVWDALLYLCCDVQQRREVSDDVLCLEF